MTENPVDIPDRRWCRTCGEMQDVIDESDEGYYNLGAEWEVHVVYLACDHQVTGQPRRVGSGPGAPYAPGAHATIRDARRAGYREAAAGRQEDDPWA